MQARLNRSNSQEEAIGSESRSEARKMRNPFEVDIFVRIFFLE
jgi:hypothetical protein